MAIRLPEWTKSSWRNFRITQQPTYPKSLDLDSALEKLSKLPGLVSHHDIMTLRQHLADAVKGKMFLIQAGDCAEKFSDCGEEEIRGKISMLHSLGQWFTKKSRIPVIRVGRLAGQVSNF
jgi:3-deoxy-7-phosphoheptulonate synthase